jgi:hypothetical protein
MIGTCDHCEQPARVLVPCRRLDTDVDSDIPPWSVCGDCRSALPDIFEPID